MASGGRVCVGNFNANGLKVNDDNDDNDNDNDNIGRALARNFYLPFFISCFLAIRPAFDRFRRSALEGRGSVFYRLL